ncbi:hypothetical protein GUITHDRAFT_149238 [Guillardia theta CCMP2712]|uniref:DNA primase n=2 Tax=Guillardia theta TaxID=55529 RepID=L1I6L3_GUITC|nr:hypothetical protein GUITHDRAFT_149238 [Guillardia theta CCMP2712]EKX31524.1 hypothetical protein GUITHDRAFT_149238 [Guillardia theta CCMP2712]|eukprot:XP_005818504.1 hypothetical protein GUITHDRAFT_149238 [Guillardia theta CCMP2712]
MCPTQVSARGRQGVRTLFHYLQERGIFDMIAKIFFPFQGLKHADIMAFKMSTFKGKPIRRDPVSDLYDFIRKNDICSLHLGAELNIPVTGTNQTYHPCNRMLVMDIDTVMLDPLVHLLMISQICQGVYTNFVRESTKDINQIMVCCSGKGWHIYFAFKQLYWSSSAEEWQRDTETNIRSSIYKSVAPVPILSSRTVSNTYISLHSQDSKWQDDVLTDAGEVVWIPYWNRVWYQRIEPYFIQACNTHPHWLSQYGPIKSVLHQLCCFVHGIARKYVLNLFAPVSAMTTIAEVHEWIETMQERVSWFQTKSMFKTPEYVKISIAYACIELECRKTGFLIDPSLSEPSRMLRAPFSPKLWDSGDDGYVSIPLGNPYTALDNDRVTLKLSDFRPSEVETNIAHFKLWWQTSIPNILPAPPARPQPKKTVIKASVYNTYELF